MKFFLTTLLLLGLTAGALRAAEEEAAVRELKALAERQRTLLARAEQAVDEAAIEDLRPQLQRLVFDYEAYLRAHPDIPAGLVSYAMLLGNPLVDERRRAVALLLKANQLDPDIPVVKNQLGKFLAEEGRPLEAINYFLAAVRLEPQEPLYHFQIGLLLSAARDDFLKSGEWTRATLDGAMLDGFAQAAALAPGNIAYAYRYGEAFYDLEQPDWAAAEAHWRALEDRVSAPLEKQTLRLHRANVLIKQGKLAEAAALLDTVTEEVLAGQKQKLVAQLPGPSDK